MHFLFLVLVLTLLLLIIIAPAYDAIGKFILSIAKNIFGGTKDE